MYELTLLGNPGHGNGPTVLLLLIAEALQEETARPVNLVLPLTGALQREIVSRRKRNAQVRVLYDEALGAALFTVTLRDHDFARNLADIRRYQQEAQELAGRYIESGLRLFDEAGEPCELAAEEVACEINIGSRIRFLPIRRAFSFFPCLLSDLLRRTKVNLDSAGLSRVRSRVEQLEASYEVAFLPYLHTFSWDSTWQPRENVRFAPFLRPEVSAPPSPPAPGVLAMPSGVGKAGNARIAQVVEHLLHEARSGGRSLEIYFPLGARIEDIPSAQPLHPDAIYSDAIQAVVGRAGWGTVGECLSAGTPFVAIPALPGDDPEIGFNLKTLESSGIAVVYRDDLAILKEMKRAKMRMTELRAEMEKEFGPVDGFQFMAAAIGRRLGLVP